MTDSEFLLELASRYTHLHGGQGADERDRLREIACVVGSIDRLLGEMDKRTAGVFLQPPAQAAWRDATTLVRAALVPPTFGSTPQEEATRGR